MKTFKYLTVAAALMSLNSTVYAGCDCSTDCVATCTDGQGTCSAPTGAKLRARGPVVLKTVKLAKPIKVPAGAAVTGIQIKPRGDGKTFDVTFTAGGETHTVTATK